MAKNTRQIGAIILMSILLITMTSLMQAQGRKPSNVNKSARIQKMDKEVRILDEKGNITRRISLEDKIGMFTKLNKHTNKEEKIKRHIVRHANIGLSNNYVLVEENIHDIALIDDKGNETSFNGEGPGTGKVELYVGQGELLFEKHLPEGRVIGGDTLMSENGETVVITSYDTICEIDEPKVIIFIFDKYGNEVIRIPSQQDLIKYKSAHVYGAEKLSANGKYLAITIDYGYTEEEQDVTRFYNLRNKKYWDAKKRYAIYEISNKGFVKAAAGGNSPMEEIDLNKIVGE